MAELQRACECDDERVVQCGLRAERAFLGGFVRDAVLLFEHAGGQGFGRDAAAEGRVVVDVEFEEVEEFVGYEVDGAVDFALDAEEELEGAAGFIAYGEGDVLELARGIGDVLACLAGIVSVGQLIKQAEDEYTWYD